MNRFLVMLAMLLVPAGFAVAADTAHMRPVPIDYAPEAAPRPGAAKAETTLVAYWDFQSSENPSQGDPQGWYGVDHTYLPPKWHLDDYACEDLGAVVPNVGNHCVWAGEVFAYDCGGTFEGYGNGYNELLVWSGTPSDPLLATDVRITGYVHVDTEQFYDYLYLEWDNGGTWETIVLDTTVSGGLDGIHDNLYIDVTQTVPVGSDVSIRFRAASDGAWSDQDCLTNPVQTTRGHSMVDELSVYFDQGAGDVLQSYEDFEGLKDVALGDWTVPVWPRVGDFAEVWEYLGDLDPCVDNKTPQFAFIDYGQIPGVGPSTSTEWTYGPGGCVVNSTGGIDSDPDTWLSNSIWSPVIELPEDMAGYELRFTVYEHMELFDMAGMFWTWGVDSSVDGYTWGWAHHHYVYYGGPGYKRFATDLNGLVHPAARFMRIELSVFQWPLYGAGEDATPAPYFDDVSLHAYQ